MQAMLLLPWFGRFVLQAVVDATMYILQRHARNSKGRRSPYQQLTGRAPVVKFQGMLRGSGCHGMTMAMRMCLIWIVDSGYPISDRKESGVDMPALTPDGVGSQLEEVPLVVLIPVLTDGVGVPSQWNNISRLEPCSTEKRQP